MSTKKYMLLLLSLVIIISLAAVIYPQLKDSYEFEGQAQEIEKASDFTVYDTDGNKVSLSDKEGKPVIVNFWATWCGYCMEELPAFDSMYGKYADDIQFMMVDLTDENREFQKDSMSFIKEHGYSFPVFFDIDQDADNTYALTSVPVTLFIDSDGNLLFTQLGAMDSSTLEKNIKALLNGDSNSSVQSEPKSRCSFH